MAIKDTVRLMRPVQWTKNSFVFAGLLFDQAWGDPVVLVAVLKTFVAFCCVASAVYILNDLMDCEEDRRHPVKCKRPIASNAVSIPTAIALFVILAAAAAGVVLSELGGWLLRRRKRRR